MPPAATTTTKTITKSLGASLVIQNVDELMKLATILYHGGASQIEGCGRPEAVAHVILAGAEVGLSPTQSLSTIMLVNGKTSVYGDGALALVMASGLMEEFKEWNDGEGDNLTYYCQTRRKGETESITRSFSVTQAKTAELWGKRTWKKFPERMQQMRPRGYALRDKFPDVLRGLMIWEEIVDVVPDVNVVNTTATVVVAGSTSNQHEIRMVAAHVDTASATPAPVQSTATPTPVVTAATVTPSTSSSSPDPNGPVTDAQKEEFLTIRNLVMASKAITDKVGQKAEWEQALAPYGVSSVGQMTFGLAAKVIDELGKKHDPFGHPVGSNASAAT